MTHRLAWRDRETGELGAGKVLYPSRHVAREVTRMMDEAWPEYAHWVQEAAEKAPEPCAAST